MKNKLIVIAISAMMATSCSTTKYFVASDYKLDTVESSSSETKVKATSQTYSDDVIDIAMQYGNNSIAMVLTNMTNSSIKIHWDDAAYIDQFGSAHRVIHLGTKLADRDKAQVPSVVPKGSKINEEVVPSDCIEWVNSTSKYVASDWKYTPISQMYMYNTQQEAENAKVKFEPVQLLLPIEADGKRYEYTFKFVDRETSVGSITQTDWTRTYLATLGVSCAALVVELIVLSGI